MPDKSFVEVRSVTHRFGQRTALSDVNLGVSRGTLFTLLGPNGSGKTTLFRIMATLIAPTAGTILIDGEDVVAEPQVARRRLGVVFQKPSLDGKLTVMENLTYHGQLYGLSGSSLTTRSRELLARFDVNDRAADRVDKLSGGLQRRVELAKSLLHEPTVLILDEPSTGLDPGARASLMEILKSLCQEGVTCLMTTHLMEDAERCDMVAILDQGKLVALDPPAKLKSVVGGDVLTMRSSRPAALAERVRSKFQCGADVVDDMVRIERPDGHTFIPDLIEAFPGEIDSVTIGKPTLEDVFVHLTGRKLD